MSGALLRYRIMAWVTGVFLLTMTIWLILGYTVFGYGDGHKPAIYGVMWTGHGWLYFIYLITAVDLTFRVRWSMFVTLGVLVAGTIPLASFFADHYVSRRYAAEVAAGKINPGKKAVGVSTSTEKTDAQA